MILKGYAFGIGYALVCLLLSFVLYKLGVPKKYTRKAVHILVGFEWVILYHFMGAGIHFLAVCILFLVLLFIAYKGRLMPMISSDSDNAPGTVYYALAMAGVSLVGCFIPEVMLSFGIGVMCTSIGDGFAGVIGQLIGKGNPKIYFEKTLLGSVSNLVLSSLSAFVISLAFGMELNVAECLLIGLLSAELELITPFGLDNISITWGTTALAFAFMYFGGIGNYLLPIILSPIIIIFATKKKALTTGGVVMAIILDIAVSVAFGNSGFVILVIYFASAIIVDKIKKRYKNKSRNESDEATDCRNYMQVIANGLVAFVASVAYFFSGKTLFVVPFVASLAESFSDTAASGIGIFSKTTYDPFRRRFCENGLSGGMSALGTSASLISAFLLSVFAFVIGIPGFGVAELFIVAFSAFLGAVFDSLLGSLLQVKYKCTVCNSLTEREVHCSEPTVKHSGFELIDNDVVNMLSCAFAGVLATVLAILV